LKASFAGKYCTEVKDDIPIYITSRDGQINSWLKENIFDVNETVVGVDSEWVSGSIETDPLIAVFQIATKTSILLFHFQHAENKKPALFLKFLESKEIQKVSVSILHDALILSRKWDMQMINRIDCQFLDVGSPGENTVHQMPSLALLVEKYVGVPMEKSAEVRKSCWEDKQLTEDQIFYAALDAWICIILLEKIVEVKNKDISGDLRLPLVEFEQNAVLFKAKRVERRREKKKEEQARQAKFRKEQTEIFLTNELTAALVMKTYEFEKVEMYDEVEIKSTFCQELEPNGMAPFPCEKSRKTTLGERADWARNLIDYVRKRPGGIDLSRMESELRQDFETSGFKKISEAVESIPELTVLPKKEKRSTFNSHLKVYLKVDINELDHEEAGSLKFRKGSSKNLYKIKRRGFYKSKSLEWLLFNVHQAKRYHKNKALIDVIEFAEGGGMWSVKPKQKKSCKDHWLTLDDETFVHELSLWNIKITKNENELHQKPELTTKASDKPTFDNIEYTEPSEKSNAGEEDTEIYRRKTAQQISTTV